MKAFLVHNRLHVKRLKGDFEGMSHTQVVHVCVW